MNHHKVFIATIGVNGDHYDVQMYHTVIMKDTSSLETLPCVHCQWLWWEGGQILPGHTALHSRLVVHRMGPSFIICLSCVQWIVSSKFPSDVACSSSDGPLIHYLSVLCAVNCFFEISIRCSNSMSRFVSSKCSDVFLVLPKYPLYLG